MKTLTILSVTMLLTLWAVAAAKAAPLRPEEYIVQQLISNSNDEGRSEYLQGFVDSTEYSDLILPNQSMYYGGSGWHLSPPSSSPALSVPLDAAAILPSVLLNPAVVSTSIVATPEPSPFTLIALGLMVMAISLKIKARY